MTAMVGTQEAGTQEVTDFFKLSAPWQVIHRQL